MHARTASLFPRLRAHRGAWLLVFAAIILKIAAATVCVLDGPRVAVVDTPQAASVQADVAQASIAGDDDDCLLGEPGGCHCACAHAVTLPATAPFIASIIVPREHSLPPPVAPSLRAAVSPLRPPIA